MNRILNTAFKVRIIALGCGNMVSQYLMLPGSSAWLHSIHLPYAVPAVDEWGGAGTKFVSRDRVEAIMEQLVPAHNVVDIVISGKLKTINEREGRENLFHYGIREPRCESEFGRWVLENSSRQFQETMVAEFVLKRLADIKRKNTRIIYPGSFNPVHEAHVAVVNHARVLSSKPPIIEMARKHFDKDNSGSDIDQRMADALDVFENRGQDVVWAITDDQPKYIDKYYFFDAEYLDRDFIFLMGHDIWEKWGESLKKDFKEIDNAQFLVTSRGENVAGELHRLLHPLSWSRKVDPKLLNMSSSQIRNEND